MDAKAILKLGELSRRGQSRGQEAVKAQDQDLNGKEKFVPLGVLEVVSGMLTLLFGTSYETSDFIVDCLENWWEDRKDQHTHIRELVINLDHAPELGSGRRQFIQRTIEFVERYQLNIHLVYYPPYHRTYNPVKRVWDILENRWNRTLLTDRETAIEWAKTMTWKSIPPS